MKKQYFLLSLLATALLFSCNKDESQEDAYEARYTIDFNINEATVDLLSKDETTACATMELIAGQFHNAGIVIIERDAEYLYITYETTGGWVIDATHMFAGVCTDIPETRSGNPKVGVFDYSTTHSEGTNTVSYAIEIDFFEEAFCVAAHAEVSLIGETGNVIQQETAWGSGTPFDGNSWAMYGEFDQTGCTDNGDGPVER